MAGRFEGRNVLVAGAGVSGRSAAEALLAAGAAVTVTDASADRLAALASLQAQGAELVAGLSEPPAGTDLVVTSPGWRPDSPLLAVSVAAGVEVIGEVELAWRLDQDKATPATWLAVTGTNGKTTTVSMLESILLAAGVDVVACGNVGLPVVDAVRAGHEVLAVELSSFQLHWSDSVAAFAAVVLNLAADHLDWHGSLVAYGDAKAKVYAGNSVAVANADDAWSTRLSAAAAADARRVSFTLGVPQENQLGVEDASLVDRAFGDGVVLASLADVHPAGPHNVANALAAAALARAHGVAAAAVAEGLRSFEPGAHRSVPVAEAAGVSYVDDSKATNPHAADAALRAHPRVVWIAGGLLKGAEVDDLVAANADRLAAVVLIGRDRDRFAAALARHAPDVPVREVAAGDDAGMLEAVRVANGFARPGSVVLLAPAAASMDMFTDYAHRGRAFADAVRAVLADATAATHGR
ncbi:UDP-N-acetylmuramoyl-L-alanine--D-glutamate ligase [Saccharopolyspora spinosa]|uniref:UDP-N-acetylmuramoylalanine--D-glutamate ligase n=1 Tax=Saccharopolyspora spinosa TaxID=60894 RepID=A0A2N3Y999_SACSN|nr:UDP-N-acetylmuramoyl-L-alanine--D-glutamate ligase [Saccharopolyspora spinosa]PKW19423.1 UDP-N-acetylmuramoylalanine--D-glutamate ligase [Saccharopolyspora spinosa]